MYVRFLNDFSWKPRNQVTIDYRRGQELSVPAAIGEAAVAVGAAVAMKRKRKGEDENGAKGEG